MYTLAKAIQNAIKNNLKVAFQGYCKKDGRIIFFVTSQRDGNLFHPVHHTGSHFECDCDSYENRNMCAHIGCVVLFMKSLSSKERTKLLTPRKNVLIEAISISANTQEKERPAWMMR